MAERCLELRPRSPARLPGAGSDGVARVRGGILERLLHVEGDAVLLRVAQRDSGRFVLEARGPSRAACDHGLERMRFALGVDDDVSEFLRRNRDDPLIGRLVRARPGCGPSVGRSHSRPWLGASASS